MVTVVLPLPTLYALLIKFLNKYYNIPSSSYEEGLFYSSNNMNRYTILFIIVLIALTGCKKQTLEERIYQEARQFTLKNCPKTIDQCTTLDSCTFSIAKRSYYYNYTVTDNLDIDSLYTQELYDMFREQLLSDIKNSIQLKTLKDAGISFCYRYYSARSGKVLMQQKFTPKDYK